MVDGPPFRLGRDIVHHRIDEAPTPSLLGGNIAPDQQHLERQGARDDLRQVERAYRRYHAMPHFGIPQHGTLGGKAQVAVQRQGHAHADAIAVQRRDDGFDQGDTDAGNGAQQDVGGDHAPGAVDLLDVGAGAERFFTGAGEDGDADTGIVGYLLPDRSEPLLGRDVERIEYLRPVERNDCNPVGSLLQKNRHSSHHLATHSDGCSRLNGARRDRPAAYRHACSRWALQGGGVPRQLIFPIGRGIIIFRVGQRRPSLKERHRA